MKQYRLQIDGMGCMNCVRGVERALKEVGATVASCEIGGATVQFDGATALLKQAIEEAGFDVKAIEEV